MWWLIVVIAIVIWLNYRKKNKQEGSENIQKDDKQTIQHKNEKDRIYAEADKKIARANKLGIPELITKEYHDHIRCYPSWIKDSKNREWVYPLVTDAVKLEPEKSGEDDKKEKIKIILKGKNYIFSYKEHSFSLPDGEWCTTGDLELYEENKKVLELSIAVEYEKIIGAIYSPSSIKAFIEGDWVNDFKDLVKWEKEHSDKAMNDLLHPSDEIDKLKKGFGIE